MIKNYFTVGWRMLSKDFVVLMIIACGIALPVSYYLISKWLDAYVYRTDISVWILFATSLGAVVITLIMVSFQSIRAARMNPVKSWRTE